MIKADGSPMGPLLRAVNAIAKSLAPKFPRVAVDTLSYQYTQVPPTSGLKPEPNVIIRLCDISSNSGAPLTDPSNAAFAKVINNWFKLTSRIWIWNYVRPSVRPTDCSPDKPQYCTCTYLCVPSVKFIDIYLFLLSCLKYINKCCFSLPLALQVVDFGNYVQSFPNYYVLGPNTEFFSQHGVRGIFQVSVDTVMSNFIAVQYCVCVCVCTLSMNWSNHQSHHRRGRVSAWVTALIWRSSRIMLWQLCFGTPQCNPTC